MLALQLLRRMPLSRTSPSTVTHNAALRSCASAWHVSLHMLRSLPDVPGSVVPNILAGLGL